MTIESIDTIRPYIYCYSTPGVSYHDGWVKIGYTEQLVNKRVRQQASTPGIRTKIEWQESAIYTDGSQITFTDDDFRGFLESKGVRSINDFGENGEPIGDEWYEISPDMAKKYLDEFRQHATPVSTLRAYKLRPEQKNAVSTAVSAIQKHKNDEALWNAKPRFGKCLSCYDFCRNGIGAQKVLIVTNRPSVANSWYADYEKYLGRESGYFFVSKVPEIKNKALVLTYEEFRKDAKKREEERNAQRMSLIYFASLQDIKSSAYFGGNYAKLKELTEINWDVLVVDESHEGVYTNKTDAAFDRIHRRFTLYLSGTPFKAIQDNKFDADEIYNWTYVEEQESKKCWNEDETNPYLQMPEMNVMTYKLSSIIGGRSPDFSEEEESIAADRLNTFFKAPNERFVNDTLIDKFLDVISSEEKYPFGTEESRAELAHTYWLVMRIDSAKALARKLKRHPVFGQYEIIVAAGDGKVDDGTSTRKAFSRVTEAIRTHERTITIDVKTLTTGVTIPQWTGVMMLSERESAQEYMQAMFRAQNPYIFTKTDKDTGEITCYRKSRTFVFDFNPEHTLDIIEQFANNLYSETAGGKGDYAERKQHIEKLIKYLPVIGESDDGGMKPFDAEKILLIPRKLRSQEVVRRGFMCDALFRNISNVFHLSAQTIVDKLPIIKNAGTEKAPFYISDEEMESMHLNEGGEVEITKEDVRKQTAALFSEEEKAECSRRASISAEGAKVSPTSSGADRQKERKRYIGVFADSAQKNIAELMCSKHPDITTRPVEKKIRQRISKEATAKAERLYEEYIIDLQTKETEIRNASLPSPSKEEALDIEARVAAAKEKAQEEFAQKTRETIEDFIQNDAFDIAIKTAMEIPSNALRDEKIKEFKKHLKGFTRTIPSFLMAYGNAEFKLENIEKMIPEDVFQEVTSITTDEFKILRDECKFFDPVVFNDAVRAFMSYKDELSDYFDVDKYIVLDGTHIKDIFDLIPPQKTNQIYTPRKVVIEMLDYLEKENPGCFDDVDATFIDPYMKSGLYITEIVKRLYNSPSFKDVFPDGEERLDWIFKTNVYGLAPTEIIYRIATSFIFGFQKFHGTDIKTDHFKMCDMLIEAQKGTFQEKLNELFDDTKT